MKIETIAIHLGNQIPSDTKAAIQPITLSTTFEKGENGDYPGGFIYSRSDNPNRKSLEKVVAALENGVDACAFSTGNAAGMAVFQALKARSHIICPDDMYHGLRNQLKLMFNDVLTFDFIDFTNLELIKDTINKQKTISRNSHQMALRTMHCTRLKAINCHFKAYAGDTVSPWEVDNGMWYFKDCIMEGGVDFYCPRGWAFAENCEFIAHTGSAAIWHDGSRHEDSKTVLLNCWFKGYDGFLLGRYHRDAQFYLINCLFADNMKDAPIYRVATTNNMQWGERIYYYNCHRKAGDYTWFNNNISKALAQSINAKWVFGERWNP